jgi:hypothetical protein
MHAKYIEAHFAHRRAQIGPMLTNPGDYKVCCSCLSIALTLVSLCPFCRSYRWMESRVAVTTVASVMLSSPYPRNVGYPPRLPGNVPLQKQVARSPLPVAIARKEGHANRP